MRHLFSMEFAPELFKDALINILNFDMLIKCTNVSDTVAWRLPNASFPRHVGLAAHAGVVAQRDHHLLAVAVGLANHPVLVVLR